MADYGDRIGFFVESESGLEAKEVLEGQRRFGLAFLEAVFGVSVELDVKTIWNNREKLMIIFIETDYKSNSAQIPSLEEI